MRLSFKKPVEVPIGKMLVPVPVGSRTCAGCDLQGLACENIACQGIVRKDKLNVVFKLENQKDFDFKPQSGGSGEVKLD
jgi:hypothetical protein